MIHTSCPCISHVGILDNLSRADILIAGGTTDVAIELNCTNEYAYAESFGFDLVALDMLRVISACGISPSHSMNVKSGSSEANPAMKRNLKFRIPLSDKYVWWIWGGTNW